MTRRLRPVAVIALLVVAAAAASVALATVPIAATVKLSSPRPSTAAKPQSSSIAIDIDSCATPSASCPRSSSITVTGAPGMRVNGANIKRGQLCNLGNPPDGSKCPSKSVIGHATISAYADIIGTISAPATVYAARGSGKHLVAFAIYGSAAGNGLTFPGTISEAAGTIVISIPSFSVPAFGTIQPVLYKLSGLTIDRVKKLRSGGRRSVQHLFANPAACTGGSWTFTVTERFQGDSGTVAATQPCG